MSETLIAMPTVAKHSHPSYHLKSEFPTLDFSEFNVRRDFSFEQKYSEDENYAQTSVITTYAVSVEESMYYCEFTIETPFETNKHTKLFTKEDFENLLNFHNADCKDFVDDKALVFPEGIPLVLKYQDIKVGKISESFLSL